MDPNGQRYIELLKNVLTDYNRMDFGEYKPINARNATWKTKALQAANQFLKKKGYEICRKVKFKKENRLNGLDWPAYADTMIGLKRLNNLEFCIRRVVEDGVQGDFIETGVWRGGATIFMKAMLASLGDTSRRVWVADSFEGLPKPDSERYPSDKLDEHYKFGELAVSQKMVEKNFEKYNLLDDRVKFLKGWFRDTLPSAPIEKIAILRLDGDMYESTMDGLANLYHKVSSGGYIIVDDYNAIEACKQAVHDFRTSNAVQEEMILVDQSAVFWRKQ